MLYYKEATKNFENLQENACAEVTFFHKVTSWKPATLSKKDLRHRCFPVNLTKFSKAVITISSPSYYSGLESKPVKKSLLLRSKDIPNKTFCYCYTPIKPKKIFCSSEQVGR